MKNGIFMAIVLAIWGVLKLILKILKGAIQILSSLIVFLGLYIPLFYFFFGLILLATTDFSFGGRGTDQILYYIGLGLCCLASLIISIRNLLVRPISSVFLSFRKESDEDQRETARDQDDRYPESRHRDSPRYREERSRPVFGSDSYRRKDGTYFYSEEQSDRRNEQPYDPSDYYDRETQREGTFARRRIPAPYEERRYSDRSPYDYAHETPLFNRSESYQRQETPLVYYSKRRPGVLVKEYADRFDLFMEDASGRKYIGTEYKDD